MSELLEVEPGDKALEMGTGSGYQAAVLAEMGIEVYTGRSRRQTPFCVGKPVSSPGFPTQNAPENRRRGEGDPEQNL